MKRLPSAANKQAEVIKKNPHILKENNQVNLKSLK